MEQYPTLNFLLTHGSKIAAGLAAAVVVAGVLAVLMGANWLWLVAGVVFAAIGYGVARSYVELIQLVTDMLVPK
jgi:hypothetical protein